MKINFQNDTINAFGENTPLITTTSGHYTIPLASAKQVINNIDRDNNSAITLTINNISEQSNQTIAFKSHQQFAHPSSERLMIHLLNNAGTPWCNNTDIKNEIKNVTRNCSTCQVYHKAPHRPIVGLPMANNL